MDGICAECEECKECGWERAMPYCPIENSDDTDAEWKVYRPRVESDGRSFRDELTTVKGTRKEFMAMLKKLFDNWSPHDWVNVWTTHMHHLTYATFHPTEMVISTDFSAQIEHKAEATRTCEHAPRSNMAVFIVTHSPRLDNNKRRVETDVWRIFWQRAPLYFTTRRFT
jgi:hypothetical protein